MSSVWDILQWGSTIKVSIELPVASRHRRDMTEKLLKVTLNPNTHTHTHTHFRMTSFLPIIYLYSNSENPGDEQNRIHHWCSVGTGKSHPEGPPFQWPLEQWTRGLGFSCWRWTSTINSFSHIPSLNNFKNDTFSLFEQGSVRGKWEKLTKSAVKQFWYQHVPFVLTKKTHTHICYFCSQTKEL